MQRNWPEAGKNVVVLAAAGVAAATHTPAVPVAVLGALFSALRRGPKDPDATAFLERLVDGIEAWCRSRSAFGELGDEPSGWRSKLLERLADEGLDLGDDLAAVLADTVFEPTGHDTRRSRELAEELLAAIPRLILAAGDRCGVGAAAVALVDEAVAKIDQTIRDLDPAAHRAGDAVLASVYLTRLISRLDRNDLTPPRRAGPATLTGVQQRLRLARSSRGDDTVFVDDLAQTCDRLVVLGGPGSGKSWTARQVTMQAAQAALDRLAEGDDLDEIEIPVIAACSQVLERSDMFRWERLVNATLQRSAIDPGQTERLQQVLRRHQRLLIVLDGLDEAAAPEPAAVHDLIDTRPDGTIRLLLTSRPGAWDSDRPIVELAPDNDRHQSGTLEPFSEQNMRKTISAWLHDIPAAEARLLALADNPASGIARHARVPLLCAIYCIAARPDPDRPDDDPFAAFAPGQHIRLFDRVILRLLAGSWRYTSTKRLSKDQTTAALKWLQDLAAAGDDPDPAGNGLAKWPDVIPTPRDPPAGTDAHVDNVAHPDPYRADENETRRFIHRSLREHLFAKTLCDLSPPEAAERILPHLWFDRDWAEVIPTVLAGHHDPDTLLDCIRAHPAVLNDPTYSLDDHLVEAAVRCSPQPGISPKRDAHICAAIVATAHRTSPARWGQRFAGCVHWPATGPLLPRLVAYLADPARVAGDTPTLARALVTLALGPHAQLAAGQIAARLADPELDPIATSALTRALVALNPDGPRARTAAEQIAARLADPALDPPDVPWLARAVLALGGPHAQAAAEQIASRLADPALNLVDASMLAHTVLDMAPGGPHVQAAAEQIAARLADPALAPDDAPMLARVLVALSSGGPHAQAAAEQIAARLADPAFDPRDASRLAEAVVDMAPGGPHVQAVAEQIAARLADPALDPDDAPMLAEAVVDMAPGGPHVQAVAEQIAARLADPALNPHDGLRLARVLVTLAPDGQRAQAAADLLASRLADPALDPDATYMLAQAVVTLAPGGQRAQAAADLLASRLADPALDPDATYMLAQAVVDMPPDGQRAQAVAEQIAARLADPALDPRDAPMLAEAVVTLAPDGPHAQAAAEQIASRVADPALDPDATYMLAQALVDMAPGGLHAQAVAERIAVRLADPALDPRDAPMLAEAVVTLAPGGPQTQAAAEQIAARLADPALDPRDASMLAEAVVTLAPGGPQAQAAAEQIAARLADPALDPPDVPWLARAVLALGGPHAQAAAEQIAARLADPALDPRDASMLAEAVVSLAPGGLHAQAAAERIAVRLADPALDPRDASMLAEAVVSLTSGGPHAQAADLLAARLADPALNPRDAPRLARALVILATGGPHAQAAAEQIAARLADPALDPHDAPRLAEAVVNLAPDGPHAQAAAEQIAARLADPTLAPDDAPRLTNAMRGLRRFMCLDAWADALGRGALDRNK